MPPGFIAEEPSSGLLSRLATVFIGLIKSLVVNAEDAFGRDISGLFFCNKFIQSMVPDIFQVRYFTHPVFLPVPVIQSHQPGAGEFFTTEAEGSFSLFT
jgi:hypothetical protein